MAEETGCSLTTRTSQRCHQFKLCGAIADSASAAVLRCQANGLRRTQRKCHNVMTLVVALTADISITGQPFAIPIVAANAIVAMSFHRKYWCSRAETPPVRPVWRMSNT